MTGYQAFIEFVRAEFGGTEVVPLHVPTFCGNEQSYVAQTVASEFVSSVGSFVDRFEETVAAATGRARAVATVSGTAALHAGLRVLGVEPGDLVVTQPLSFVATANAISYCGAQPAFLDIDAEQLSLAPNALEAFCERACHRQGRTLVHSASGRRVAACVAVHSFGHPFDGVALAERCQQYGLALLEDAAEALGSTRAGRPAGTAGDLAVVSFNGNKIATAGGGGAIVTDDDALADTAKYLTTTAKRPDRWDYYHDRLGYNYRLPNLNAALACAQLEWLAPFVANKRELAERYAAHLADYDGLHLVREPAQSRSNYWLNTICFASSAERQRFLEATNAAGILTRPVWHLLADLPMYRACVTDGLATARAWGPCLANIPSSVRRHALPARPDTAAQDGARG